ncbi:HAD hydrolase-like protein [Brachybacterium sp. FME24]|uniref:HAD hydrolase-like protein n=1 Tax=Brachybacterium sp. FME24 TaxID=2742605 RepID=UPI00186726AB|nr:HAD hydrolase-like protein [Brachybacterium sp. FME24]
MTAHDGARLTDIPVVLLDLDGTIVDSGPGILDGLAHAFARCGEPLPPASVLRTFIGPPLADSFQGTLGLSPERSEELRLAYTAHYQQHGLLSAAPYAGIPSLVSALTSAGRTVAVATNKPESSARRLLSHQGLDREFALIGGTDRAIGREDKAAVIGSVLERLGVGVDADDTAGAPPAVMVGDRLHDAAGAAEHGLPAVLVGWGYGGEVESESGLPLARTVQELTEMLLG